MRNKVITAIIAAALALMLVGCGENEKSSAPANSSDKTNSVSSSNVQQSTPAESSSSNSSSTPEVTERHYYKTIVFYGNYEMIFTGTQSDGGEIPDYNTAVALHYNTTNGDIEKITVTRYYEISESNPEKTEQNRSNLLDKYNPYPLFNFTPASEETFSYKKGSSDIKLGAVTWELPGDTQDYPFNQFIIQHFNNKFNSAPKQDIDGFIKDTVYKQAKQGTATKIPAFSDNGFACDGLIDIQFAVHWYDKDFSVSMRDELMAKSSSNHTMIDSNDVEKYGSTTFNFGGGF